MTDIVERLRSEGALAGHYDAPAIQREAADEIERLREALARVMQWAEAYPEDIFPPVDLDFVRAKLGDDEMFSRMHAQWGRRLCKGIGGIARAALGENRA